MLCKAKCPAKKRMAGEETGKCRARSGTSSCGSCAGRRLRNAPRPVPRSSPCSRGCAAESTALPHIEVGLDVSDVACDVVLFSEFTNRAALSAYANHPERVRGVRRLATGGSDAFKSIIPSKRPAHDRFVHL